MRTHDAGRPPSIDARGDVAPGRPGRARRAAVALAIGLLGLMVAAALLTEEPSVDAIADCASISDGGPRLKCYDDAVRHSDLQPARGAVAPRMK